MVPNPSEPLSDPPSPTGNRTDAYDQKLEHVLAAGSKVIAREGYGQATIRQVAAEAGMSIAGLYHYFASKEELLYLIQYHTFDAILQHLVVRLSGLSDPRQRLRAMISNHLEHFLARMDDLKVCTHEMRSLRGAYFERVRELRQEYLHTTENIVDAIAQARGGGSIEPHLATLYLFGMLNWIYMWYPREGGESGDLLADRLVTVFLDGFLPRESSASSP